MLVISEMTEEKLIKRRNRKPSAKMEKFGKLLAAGNNTIVECYKMVYDAKNMSHAVARNEASKLANHPTITVIVEQEKARLSSISADREKQKRMSDSIQHTSDRERVLERLRQWLDSPPDSALQLRAAEALAKAVGLNGQTIEVKNEKSSHELLDSITAILESVEESQTNSIH